MVGVGRDGVQQVSARDDGGPASATPIFEDGEIVGVTAGMSLRDVFAAHAAGGLLAHPDCQMVGPGHEDATRCTAREAYAIADAMLAARKQP